MTLWNQLKMFLSSVFQADEDHIESVPNNDSF